MIFPKISVKIEPIEILGIEDVLDNENTLNLNLEKEELLKRMVAIIFRRTDERKLTVSVLNLSHSEFEKLGNLSKNSASNNIINAELYSITDYNRGKLEEVDCIIKSIIWKD